MIFLNDVIDCCRAEALAAKLYPTDESDYRWFCREYSKTFHVPLNLVFDLEPEHVILYVLEDGLDGKSVRRREDADQIVTQLRRLEDPNYDATKEKEMSDYAADIEAWDAKRLAAGKPLPTKFDKNEEPSPKPIAPEKKSGFVDLSYLENQKNER